MPMANVVIKATGQLRSNQATLAAHEYQITYCSEQCVFHNVPDNEQAVVQSAQAGSIALLSAGQLWLNISHETHAADHPLYVSEQQITVSARAQLLRTVQQAKPVHVVSVRDVCACGMIIDVLEGLPLANVHQRPAWHRSAFRSEHDDALATMSWSMYLDVIADLAEGVQALHEAGIVHGDLFAFNAIVQDEHGIWIDLNDILPATARGVAVDVWTFMTYTVMTSLMRLKHWQPTVIADAFAIVEQAAVGDILRQLASHFRQARQQNREEQPFNNSDLSIIGEIYQRHAPQQRSDELGSVARLLSAKGLLHTYRAYEWNAAVAMERERFLAAEQSRHMLVERELQRTLSQRYEGEITALKHWINELEQGKSWLDEQCVRLQASLEQQQDWIDELERGKTWLDEQRANWQTEAERLMTIVAEQQQWITELEQAKAWNQQQAAYWQAQASRWQAQAEKVPGIIRKLTDSSP